MTTLTAVPPVSSASPLLIDGLMPTYDAETSVTIVVAAPVAATFAAIENADFGRMPDHDPLMRALVQARGLPDRIARRLRGVPEETQLFESGARLAEMSEGPDAWIRLGETPGQEFAFGAIGRFTGAQATWRPTTAADFGTFAEPGWVKVGASLSARPYGERRSLLTYDCRSAATDDAARAAFVRYWRLVSPGIRLVLWRTLVMIGREAQSVQPPEPSPR